MKKTIKFFYNDFEDVKNLKDSELYVWTALKSIYNFNYEEVDITIDGIYNILTNIPTLHSNTDRSRIKLISDGIKGLSNKGFIDIIFNKNRRYILNLSNINKSSDSYYTFVDVESLINIINKSSINIIKYLLYLLKCKEDNNNLYYFNISKKTIMEDLSMANKTIDKYNKILIDNKIIYIYKYNFLYKDSLQNIPSVYGLFEDREKIYKFCLSYIRQNIDKNIIKSTSSKKHL